MANLEVITKHEIGSLSWNFEDLKKGITAYSNKYKNLVFTEENLTEAKNIRAEINKVKKTINDKKIEEKKAFSEPLILFENQAKELLKILDDTAERIDVQIKTFEDKEKADKKTLIEEWYNTRGVGLSYVKFEQIFEEKWLNKSVSEKSWKSQISGIVETIKTNVAIIKNMTEKDTKLLGQLYLEDLNLNLALTRYEAIKERERAIEQQKNQEVQDTVQVENTYVSTSIEVTEDKEEILTRAFKVFATKQQIIDLANYMNAKGIKFEKI